jgi:hypothetical protein
VTQSPNQHNSTATAAIRVRADVKLSIDQYQARLVLETGSRPTQAELIEKAWSFWLASQ